LFLPRRAWEIAKTHVAAGWYFYKLHKLRRRIESDRQAKFYTDLALTHPLPADLKSTDEPCGEPAPFVVKLPVTNPPPAGSEHSAPAA
jgi:hypothetical protein